jgi:hypothetical protein
MIVQVAGEKFVVPTVRLVVPFASPSRSNSILAVAFTLATSEVTVGRVSDGAASVRGWKLAHDTVMGNLRRIFWVRVGGPPSVVELVGEPANAQPVRGTALALEAQAHPAAALQLLSDLLLEAAP